MRFLILIAICLFLSCTTQPTEDSEVRWHVPENAKNICRLGNGWITFEVNIDGMNRKFLYHKSITGYKGFEAVTEIR